MTQRTQKELVGSYLLGAWFLKIRLMSSRRQLWAKEASIIHLENAALQFRKICEMISYMCIAASGIETGEIPTSLKGFQVGLVLDALAKGGNLHFPRPARLSQQEIQEGDTQRWSLDIAAATAVDISRIRSIHQQTNQMLHEISPLGKIPNGNDAPASVYSTLLAMRADHQWMWNRFWQHAILINEKILFINLGETDQHERPTIIKHEDLLKEEIHVQFDPDCLADFSGKIDWSEFDDDESVPTDTVS